MKKIVALALLAVILCGSIAEAGRYSSSRSYSSRSYRSSPPVVHNNTIIIHHDAGSSSLMPFAFGMMIGHSSSPQPQTVIVQPQAQVVVPATSAENVVTKDAEEDKSLSPFQVFVLLFAAMGLILGVMHFTRKV